jgi:hypothetical protein
VNVVQSVDIGTKSSADLPSVGLTQSFKTVNVGMQILKLTYVDKVLGLDQ